MRFTVRLPLPLFAPCPDPASAPEARNALSRHFASGP